MVVAGGVAQATADGPDHYRVRGVSPGHHLTLRAEPSTASAPLARIPSNATCLRSLGCQGGLTFEEFTTLSDEQKRRRAAENPRWCKVDFRGTVGWVAGQLPRRGCVFARHHAGAGPLIRPGVPASGHPCRSGAGSVRVAGASTLSRVCQK